MSRRRWQIWWACIVTLVLLAVACAVTEQWVGVVIGVVWLTLLVSVRWTNARRGA